MAISKSDIKFYLTSVEPGVEQTIHSQSIGGYPAVVLSSLTKSLLYKEAVLAANVPIYGETLTLSSFSNLSAKTLLGVNSEVIQVTAVSSNTVAVEERSINSVLNSHLTGDIVRGLTTSLFNKTFNDSFKQYRCIAVRNNGTFTAYGLEVFLKGLSRNAQSDVRIAIEIPQNDYISSTVESDGANKREVKVGSDFDDFDDNHFINSALRFTGGSNSGQVRIVSSFDADTGVILVDSDLPYIPLAADAFEIDPSPAQRVLSGLVSPVSGARVSDFSLPSGDETINININGNRDHGNEFRAKDVFYVWFERTLSKTALAMDNNSISVTLRYSVS